MVLEFGYGGELFDYIVQEPFSDQICRYYLHQLIEGMKYIHGKNYCHRDLKLQNLLFGLKFNMLIGDFGFAKKLGILADNLGTEFFKAPEIWAG